MAEYLAASGRPPETAHALATAAVSAVEGAMIVSRAQRSVEPLRQTALALATLVDGPAGVHQ